jgi:hypothetical protein
MIGFERSRAGSFFPPMEFSKNCAIQSGHNFLNYKNLPSKRESARAFFTDCPRKIPNRPFAHRNFLMFSPCK